MPDRFHAPTTAALELARCGMEITDAVVNVRVRFDLTDADVVSVCARVDAALAAERKAGYAEDLAKAVQHEPGIVDAERPCTAEACAVGVPHAPAPGSAELHAALAPAAGTAELLAERLGFHITGLEDRVAEIESQCEELRRMRQAEIDKRVAVERELAQLRVAHDHLRSVRGLHDTAGGDMVARAFRAVLAVAPDARDEVARAIADTAAEIAGGIAQIAEAKAKGHRLLADQHTEDLAAVLARAFAYATGAL